ncbi:MAG: hypothetical protein ACRC6M_16535, partial [Microcystaceae cyanobacterium]
MLAQVSPPSSPMLLGQELLSLLRNCSDLEQFPLQLLALLGEYWQEEVCFLLLGNVGENPQQTLVSYQGKTKILAFTANFWKQGWVKRIQTHSGPLKLPPGLPEELSQERKNRWKLTRTISIASGLALCTNFQGKINGLVMIGSPQVRPWTRAEVDALNHLQDALAIAAHTFLVSQNKATPEIVRMGHFAKNLGKEENSIL